MNINPLSDIFVRYLLGDERNKDLLISFINAVNQDSELPLIVEATITNPFNLKEFILDKQTILDVKARSESGQWYNIEVQVDGDEVYSVRSLYYWSQVYSSQLKQGQGYSELTPVICINLLNFTLFTENQPHSCFMLTEQKNRELVLTDHCTIHFLELPKFTEEQNLTDPLSQWLAFFKYEGRREDIMKILLKNSQILDKAHTNYQRFIEDDAVLTILRRREMNERQIITDLKSAEERGKKEGRQEGRQEGIQEGLQEGEKKEKIEVTKSGIQQGFDNTVLSKLTGLSYKEIDVIRKDLGK
jgi:predicted transposase/invertase (TIGR01784 family)